MFIDAVSGVRDSGQETAILARTNLPCVDLDLNSVINGHAGLWGVVLPDYIDLGASASEPPACKAGYDAHLRLN
jgi:hypothetical protein